MDQQFLATVLTLFDRKQPRRLNVVCGVADGDVTTSVMYWAMRYHLLDLIGCLQFVPRKMVQAAITQATKNGWLQLQPELINNQYLLTQQGATWRAQHQAVHWHNLGAYDTLSYSQWRSFVRMLVQVLSEHSHRNSHYFVAERNLRPQVLVKAWLQVAPPGWQQAFVQAGAQMLADLPPTTAQAWVYSLSGHQFIGKTPAQLAKALHLTEWQVAYHQFEGYVKLSQIIATTPQLHALLRPFVEAHLVSNSAAKTYTLFQQQPDMVALARRRHLRPSTIEAHLTYAKIAGWSFNVPLITPAHRLQFERLTQTLPGNPLDWRFRDVKALGVHTSFFAFRVWQIERFQLRKEQQD